MLLGSLRAASASSRWSARHERWWQPAASRSAKSVNIDEIQDGCRLQRNLLLRRVPVQSWLASILIGTSQGLSESNFTRRKWIIRSTGALCARDPFQTWKPILKTYSKVFCRNRSQFSDQSSFRTVKLGGSDSSFRFDFSTHSVLSDRPSSMEQDPIVPFRCTLRLSA